MKRRPLTSLLRRSTLVLILFLGLFVVLSRVFSTSAQNPGSQPAGQSEGRRSQLVFRDPGSEEDSEEVSKGTREFGKDKFDGRDSPPDTTPYARAMIAEDRIELRTPSRAVTSTVVDVVVNNTDPNLKNTDVSGDSETNLAINPLNPNEIVITSFSGGWGTTSPLWHSTDGGTTWTKRFTIPVPPAVGGSSGCPCDQSIDYARNNSVFGTFLTSGTSVTDVYSGTTTNPATAAAWAWFTVAGSAKRTNSFGTGNTDQPWLLINKDPFNLFQDNVYVAYDDFSISPRGMRVAVAPGSNPPNFTVDSLAGFGPTGTINPGHRLAIDPSSGTVYSLFQQYVSGASSGDTFRNINYMLNRSTDGGLTWSLNGSSTGVLIANANSTQPTAKFGTVNALLGGVDHAAVDPTNGDVYYVYGNRDGVTGNNRLSVKRLTSDGVGGLTIGSASFVTGQVQAAIPSVAVNSSGVVGVFFYTFDGIVSGFPQFSAHLATSTDHGATFSTDTVLETFLSSAADNANSRQRVLGDYQQLKALGNTFYGSFCGNGVPFGRTISNHDPIFFKVAINASLAGRVRTAGGRGIRSVTVTAVGNDGTTFTARTGPSGLFTFPGVPVGQSYQISVISRRFTFQPRLVTVTDDVTNLDIVAQS